MSKATMSCAAAVAALLLRPGIAESQAAGPEFRLNSYTTNDQDSPSVAIDGDGNFVVSWVSDGQDGSYLGIFARRYLVNGVPAAGDVRVNTYTTFTQRYPSVGMDDGGNFVVSWESAIQDGNGLGIFAQRYAANGSPAGGEFRVNTYTTSQQAESWVGRSPNGSFVVTWDSLYQDGNSDGIFGQRYDASGNPAGSAFRVNTYTTGGQVRPAVAMDASGRFVVAWSSLGQDGSGFGIFGQRYDASGSAAGSEFRVNAFTTGSQSYPSVAITDSGTFLVVWGGGPGILGQRYDASGAAVGGPLTVETALNAQRPGAGMDAYGNFVVVWTDVDGSGQGTFARRFNANGTTLGTSFRVNTYTTGDQNVGRVAMNPQGNFVVVWSSNGQDGSLGGIYGQRYAFGPSRIADFEGDSKTDITVYYPPSGLWYVRRSSTGATNSFGYGGTGYAPVPGDFDGDGASDPTVFHAASGLWFIRRSTTGTTFSVGYGGPGATPVPRDYDGDGFTDVAVYYESSGLWYVRQSSTGTTFSIGYGGTGYTPVPMDYDGDGKVDVAVYNAASGLWFIRQSTTGTTFSLAFGGSGFTAVPRDFDGDGKADLAVYHEATGLWYVRQSSTGTTTSLGYGGTGYSPVPADYDGDGKADHAVYHASSGLWFIRQSTTGTTFSVGYGGSGFIPVNR